MLLRISKTCGLVSNHELGRNTQLDLSGEHVSNAATTSNLSAGGAP
jgi:hypothetical protein